MKNNKIAFVSLLFISGFLLTACGEPKEATNDNIINSQDSAPINAEKKPAQTDASDTPAQGDDLPDTVKDFSLTEIAQHASKEDCWFAIKEKVYDVSAFIASGQHNPIISQGCGKDATSLFVSRPGKGTDHPETAYSMLGQYYIGELSQ